VLTAGQLLVEGAVVGELLAEPADAFHSAAYILVRQLRCEPVGGAWSS
jgi:hypothetical protein